MTKQKVWTIPNLITVSRILLTPIFVFAYLGHNFYLAWFLFMVAGFSDALDGFLARVLNQRSELGAMLDPLADKILIVTSFLCLSSQGFISSWLTILVISRDIVIVGGLFLLKFLEINVNNKIKPLLVSKLTTTLQLLFIFLILCSFVFDFNFSGVQPVMERVVALFTLLSGIIYLRQGFKMFFERNFKN
ncbi:CDP-diacylglycerol--glycerol-3-phosphate 3-phosphatidyltransferase [Maridesulfovibrio frigidus]|uniref:CDP-diacylglycerol--glycerol-3-phosphate 3-phosphatidyltransferase n=1 Tax=Maridesulfovibrio frigidus TaxID=340956 RepID=UPI0004E17E6B|nr:CDP-diacylglycerol--glycerol-3-phosphate 3-phosphatidyltransferase [Maridesulfovibrio frigidus]